MTKTDLEKQTIKVLLDRPKVTVESLDEANFTVSMATQTVSIDEFVEIMNYLPPEIASRITGSSYKPKSPSNP